MHRKRIPFTPGINLETSARLAEMAVELEQMRDHFSASGRGIAIRELLTETIGHLSCTIGRIEVGVAKFRSVQIEQAEQEAEQEAAE